MIRLKGDRIVLVDPEDVKRLMQYRWCISGNGHVMRYEGSKGVYLHHFLVGQPLPPNLTDHINRNPLDNRKANLRITDKRGNSLNRGLRRDNTSGFTGVYRKRRGWIAYYSVNGRWTSLGYFTKKEEAANARREYEFSSGASCRTS